MAHGAQLSVVAATLLWAVTAHAARLGDEAPPGMAAYVPVHGAASVSCANTWTQGMTTGNGKLGVIMMGGEPASASPSAGNNPQPQDDTIIVSHNRLYLPVGTREVVPNLGKFLPEVRNIIHTRGYGPAMTYAFSEARSQKFPGLMFTDPFLPAFELKVKVGSAAGPAQTSLRTENFRTGEVSAYWTQADRAFVRKVFVSRADDAVVMWIGPADLPTLPAPGRSAAARRAELAEASINCDLWSPPIPAIPVRTYLQNHPDAMPTEGAANVLINSVNETTATGITLHNVYREGAGSGYDCAIRILPDGGKVECIDQRVSVKGARSVLVLMRVAPFASEKELSANQLRESLDALRPNYVALLNAHTKIHQEMFDRVSLDLRGGADRSLTTEQLLARAGRENGQPPRNDNSAALLEKMYEAARYQLICSTGDRPPHLQGIWGGTWAPGATLAGDFSLNANLPLSLSSAMSGNLPELMQASFKWAEESTPDWQLNAKNLYGADGVLAPWHQSNTGKCTQWSDMSPGGLCWTGGAGWVAHWYWDYYQYTGDKKFLAERAIPFMKQVAAFYEDYLFEDENGAYRFSPSFSADDAPGDNSTQEIMIARDLFTNLTQACDILKIEPEADTRWKAMLAKLPAYRIAPNGELQEWALAGVMNKPNHRHLPHLYAIFESEEFDQEKTPEMWKAARLAFDARFNQWFRGIVKPPATAPANNDMPPMPLAIHDRLQMALCAARFGEGDIVWEILSRIAAKNTYPSLMTQRYEDGKTMVADAAGAIPEIIHRCLVYAEAGKVDLLPALPAALAEGEIRGLKARGELSINRLKWDAGSVELEVTSAKNQSIVMRLPKASRITECSITGGTAARESAQNARRINLRGGEKATIRMIFSK